MLPEENEVRECLGHFIVQTKLIIFKLDQLKEDIQRFHLNCNRAKTVGTSVGTVGSVTALACFIAAPFTLGATIPLAIAGTIAGAAGGITNISTSITDMVKTKNYKSEIEAIGNERNEVARQLTEHLENLNQVALELQKKGLDTDSAYKLAFTYAKFGYNSFMLKKNAVTIAVGIMDSIKLGKSLFLICILKIRCKTNFPKNSYYTVFIGLYNQLLALLSILDRKNFQIFT